MEGIVLSMRICRPMGGHVSEGIDRLMLRDAHREESLDLSSRGWVLDVHVRDGAQHATVLFVQRSLCLQVVQGAGERSVGHDRGGQVAVGRQSLVGLLSTWRTGEKTSIASSGRSWAVCEGGWRH